MLDYLDSNIWGLLVVPVGVLICFGPVIIPWIIAELRSPQSDKPEEKR
jgi:hypothetical protein